MSSVQKFWPTPLRYKTSDIDVFKKYCNDIKNHLDLCLVRTADTGQVNIDAMTAPTWTTDQTNMGYLIYRFNDALQSTKPIFLKIEFYVVTWSYASSNTANSNTNGGFQTKVTFGTGSDGAGTITNPSGAYWSPFSNYYNSSVADETTSRYADTVGGNYLSYNGELGFLFFLYGTNANYRVGVSNNQWAVNLAFFVVHRTLDDYGQPDGRGYVVIGRNSGIETGTNSNFTTNKIQMYIYSSNTWTAQDPINWLNKDIGQNTSEFFTTSDGKTIVFPIKYWDPDYGIRDLPNIMFFPGTQDYSGANFLIEAVPNRPRKYKSIGMFHQWRPTDQNFGIYSCLALWE